MDQRLSIITLGVKNLQQAEQFYTEKFGWKRINQEQEIAFFQLNGIQLALYPLGKLYEDIGIPAKQSKAESNFTLAINFSTPQQVDQIFQELSEKGVEIVKQPQKVFWGGYSGYIKDNEGNHWELAHNPFLKIDQNGNIAPQS